MRIPASGRHLDHHHMPPRLAVSAENTCGQHPEQFRTSSDSVSNSFEPVPNSRRAQEGVVPPFFVWPFRPLLKAPIPFSWARQAVRPVLTGLVLGKPLGSPSDFFGTDWGPLGTVRNRFGMGSELARNRFGTDSEPLRNCGSGPVRNRVGTGSEPRLGTGNVVFSKVTPRSVMLCCHTALVQANSKPPCSDFRLTSRSKTIPKSRRNA